MMERPRDEKRPVRILQVVADGRPGGGTSHVLDLARSLAKQRFEVHFATARGSDAVGQAKAAGIPVQELDFFPRSRFHPATWARLRQLVQRLAPDVIHAHGARATLPLSLLHGRVPLVYTVHGYHFLAKPRVWRYLAMLAERRCSVAADVTVFVCDHDRRVAEGWHLLGRGGRCRVIPNGIDPADLPQAQGCDSDTIAFLGRLVPQKNPLLLIEILDRLRDRHIRLLIIGDGPCATAMRERAATRGLADRLEFLGSLPRSDGLRAVSRASVLLLPSRWEGLPLAALEAMAIGVPVVASAVGGLPELVEDGRSGFLIRSQAPEAFAGAVARLIDQPDLRRRVVEEARRVVLSRYTWARTERAYVGLYRSLLFRSS